MELKKNRDIIGMKSALIGFVLWLFITIITFLFKIVLPYSLNVAGGYLTMISIYFLMRINYM
jgi:heme/copper-type cytochrome/quinol oxidase subunit 4